MTHVGQDLENSKQSYVSYDLPGQIESCKSRLTGNSSDSSEQLLDGITSVTVHLTDRETAFAGRIWP